MSLLTLVRHGVECDCCGLALERRWPTEAMARERAMRDHGWTATARDDGHTGDLCARCTRPSHDTRWCGGHGRSTA
jgi:hypothetical protein